MNEVQNLIFIALGEASMCWSEIPSRVLTSTIAIVISYFCTLSIVVFCFGFVP